jgi:hypothetical protein
MKFRVLTVLAVCAVAGCSKIHEQRSFTLSPLGGNSLKISAPVSEQKVKVVVTSDQPVNVWILLEKDVAEDKAGDPEPEMMKSGILAQEANAKDATLTATVPGKEAFRIYVHNPSSKTANVAVTIDSQ